MTSGFPVRLVMVHDITKRYLKFNGMNAILLMYCGRQSRRLLNSSKHIKPSRNVSRPWLMSVWTAWLGQPTSELSGGERQRLKPYPNWQRKTCKGNLFILDEPTTGLHTDDVNTLLKVLHKLIDLGHTVLVIEHNVDVWSSADYLIEMGPDAGADGGEIVFTGTPEMLMEHERSTKSKHFLLDTLPQLS